MSKQIDFNKFVNSDCINEKLDVFKGVHNLLEALEFFTSTGTNEWDSYAFKALQVAMKQGIEEIEALKPSIEYMGDFMRDSK